MTPFQQLNANPPPGRPSGGRLHLCADLAIHPLEETVAGDDHPLADMNGGEVLPVQEVVGVSDRDVEDLRDVFCVEGHREVLKGRVIVFFHCFISFYIDYLFGCLSGHALSLLINRTSSG